MAGKEATVYIVDVGVTTAECHSGRVESDLDYGMRYVWDKIADTMSANRTTLTVGIVGLRTNDTNNAQYDDSGEDGYLNISMLKEMGQMKMSDLKPLQERIKPSTTSNGDALSAVIVAIELLGKHTKLKSGLPGKYKRKIVLLTDGQGSISDDDLGPISERINELNIELVVIGVDFDDLEFGYKEEDKPGHKAINEKLLKELADRCEENTFATAAEAIGSLAIPRPKVTKPYVTYSGPLKLGDDGKFPETAMCIDVKRYFRTKAAPTPPASSFASKGQNGTSSVQSSNTVQGDTEMPDAPQGDLSVVRTMRSYYVMDPSNPNAVGGKLTLEREELGKGYEYGRTVVPISELEENITVLETKESFEIIGFIPNDKYDRFLTMGESCITIAQPTNEKAVLALSSLIHALHELDSYAIARFVGKDNKAPQMLLLAPSIEPDLEALIDVPLPFAEDVRAYRFAPLDRIITTSGVVLKTHKFLMPSQELSKTMSDYVDSMDLSEFGKDEDGNPTEYMQIEDLFSPSIHRTNQAIRRRAVCPTELVGDPAETLTKYSKPPNELVLHSRSELAALIKTANIQKVDDKAKGKGKRSRREQPKPLSGLKIEDLVEAGSVKKRTKIEATNAIPDFKYMLNNIPTGAVVKAVASEACTQLSTIIHSTITKSVGTGADQNGFERAYEYMGVMREEMLEETEEPQLYNDFAVDLKKRLIGGLVGDAGKEFFFGLKKRQLGLISVAESPDKSVVSAADAKEFFRMTLDLSDRSK